VGSQLLGPGSPKRLPLIPSGPKAPKAEVLSQASGDGKIKSPFKKRELDKFRALLIAKRRSLVGDVSQLETEALRSSSGGLSHTPQHMAEQGSDSADQSLSLGLAAADRRLIKEIDAALQRIDEGRFGICELSGRPIRAERLRELPWARYSIEAARQRERNMHRGNW
jgi:RNA polymerase-binding transcription factor DksA